MVPEPLIDLLWKQLDQLQLCVPILHYLPPLHVELSVQYFNAFESDYSRHAELLEVNIDEILL